MNGNGFSTIDGNALMLLALLQPDALTDAILHAIQATILCRKPNWKTAAPN